MFYWIGLLKCPVEAKSADFGVACGHNEGLIIAKGEIIKKVPEQDICRELINIITENLQV